MAEKILSSSTDKTINNKKKRAPTKLKEGWRSAYTRDKKFFKNKEEYNYVGMLEERYQQLYNNRENNCYWGKDGGQHTSWTERWDYLEKLWNGWHAADDPDDPRPNLKSPFVFSAIQTTMSELYDQNIEFSVAPWTDNAYKKAPAIENIINEPIYRYGFKKDIYSAFQEALIKGNSFLKADYRVIEKEVQLKKLKDFTKEDKKLLDEGKPVYTKQTVIEFNDVNIEHVPLHEVFIDDGARTMHGINYRAHDYIRERTMGLPQFYYEYATDPECFNTDKICIGEKAMHNPLFEYPGMYVGTDSVVVREWKDDIEDRFIITANGVLIRNSPLPYNHKLLDLAHIKCIPYPHQFYAMGLGDILENLQVEDETFRNSLLEIMEITTNPKIIANTMVQGEFADQYATAQGGDIIGISGDPSQIQWMSPPIARLAEYMGMRAQIREDAIMLSLIDPKASALPTKTPTAFEAMQTTQATMKAWMMTLKNFAMGMSDLGKQIWAIQKQEYPLRFDDKTLEKKKGDVRWSNDVIAKKSRSMLLDGFKMKDGEDGLVKKVSMPGNKFPFEMKDEYFEVSSDEMDVILSAETMQPFSKLTKARQSQEAMAQLVPMYAKGLHKIPEVRILLKDHVHTNGLNPDLIGGDDEDDESAIERAMKQEKQFMKNSVVGSLSDKYEVVPGIPGEPVSHTHRHIERLAVLKMLMGSSQAKLDEYMQQVQTLQESVMAAGGMQQQMPTPPDDILDLQIKMRKYLAESTALTDHLSVDMMDHFEAAQAAVQSMMPAQGGGEPNIPLPSGQPTAGNVSSGAGVGEGESMIPMPSSPTIPTV
jgi:hypothetical protein